MANSSDNPSAAVASHATALNAQIDALIERSERLLLRHGELNRTNNLLMQQLDLITQERDALKSRLAAARARIDALIERLPEQTPTDIDI